MLLVRTGLLACLPFLAIQSPSAKQADRTGEMFGTVRDKAGIVQAAARVEVSSPALKEPRRVETDKKGVYRLVNLPEGTYAVWFSYRPWPMGADSVPLDCAKQDNVIVTAGQQTEADATLQWCGEEKVLRNFNN